MIGRNGAVGVILLHRSFLAEAEEAWVMAEAEEAWVMADAEEAWVKCCSAEIFGAVTLTIGRRLQVE